MRGIYHWLTGVIINRTRIIPITIGTISGEAELDLASQGIAGSAVLVPVVERDDATAHIIRTGPMAARIKVKTYGRHIAPIPWDGMTEPVTVRVMVSWNVSDEIPGYRTIAQQWDFDPGLSHIIQHNLNTRLMIESIRSGEQTLFAGFTVLDENRVRIDLTQAVPVTVSILFFIR